MAGFTKLFNSILDSTIWQEPNETRLLWITMLAMCDARGEVQASIPGLAKRAGISMDECESGLVTLSSPDRYSRTKDHEGRRIAEIDGGWRLLNHGRYRELLSADERREYNRKKQAEWRANNQKPVNDVSMTVNDNKQCQHISEAEAEAEADTKERSRALKRAAASAAKPELSEIMPTGTAADMLALQSRIQSIRPAWKLALTYEEQQSMMRNGACLASLEDADWQRIKRYLEAKLPEGTPGWQPRSRGKFIETLPDVHDHACRWEDKIGDKPKSKGWV